MDNEFIEFSMEDNVRSIPSVVDGLKTKSKKNHLYFIKS